MTLNIYWVSAVFIMPTAGKEYSSCPEKIKKENKLTIHIVKKLKSLNQEEQRQQLDNNPNPASN